MPDQLALIKAIRASNLVEVKALLDAGAPIEEDDAHGESGLAMGVACFIGVVDIIRELVQRGAKVNAADNAAPTSPLSMAVRGNRKEAVRLLVELGAQVPAGMEIGLNEHDLMLAQWKARRDGHVIDEAGALSLPEVEEIDMVACAGTDTLVLEADVLRLARDGR